MAKRQSVKNRKADRKFFVRTSNQTKRVNVNPPPMRGGTRL